MKKQLTLLSIILTLFFNHQVHSQDLQIISSSNMSGAYHDFAHDDDSTYYALSAYNGVYKINPDGEAELFSLSSGFGSFRTIKKGIDGHMYICSSFNGIYRLEDDNSFTLVYEGKIADFAFSESGDIYAVGTDTDAPFSFTVISGEDETQYMPSNSIINNKRIDAVEIDTNGVIWLGGEDGLYRFENDNLELIYSERPVSKLHIDQNNNIYITAAYANLAILKSGEITVTTLPFQTTSGYAFTGNRFGTKYASNFFNLYYQEDGIWKDVHEELNLPSGNPRGMYMDEYGNMFLSIDGSDDVFVFKNNKTDISSADGLETDLFSIYPEPCQ